MSQSASMWKLDPQAYSRIVCDHAISHGAFRLWHYLRDRAAMRGGFLKPCWPSERTIAAAIGCKAHSLRGWIDQLRRGGYLRVKRVGEHHHHEYYVLDGALPLSAARSEEPCGPLSPSVLPVSTSGVAGSGNTTNSEANPGRETNKRRIKI